MYSSTSWSPVTNKENTNKNLQFSTLWKTVRKLRMDYGSICFRQQMLDELFLTIGCAVTHNQICRLPFKMTNNLLRCRNLEHKCVDLSGISMHAHRSKHGRISTFLYCCRCTYAMFSLLKHWMCVQNAIMMDVIMVTSCNCINCMSVYVLLTLKHKTITVTLVMSPWICVTPGKGAIACRSTATIFTSSLLSLPLK